MHFQILFISIKSKQIKMSLTLNQILMKVLPEQMRKLPEDVIYYVIGSFIPVAEIIKTIIYQKYYYQVSNVNRNLFTLAQFLDHFSYPLPKYTINEFVDEDAYQAMKVRVIILKTRCAVIRMKKRRANNCARIRISSNES